MKILMIDNYDSFTYNLVEYIRELTGKEVTVKRNDELTVDEASAFDRIVISPGPGVPKDAGIICDLIRELAPQKPLLGICLGMQAMVEVFGGELINLDQVHHGVAGTLHLEHSTPIFENIPNETPVARYHSWAMHPEKCPENLQITARSEDNCVMAIQHKEYPSIGLQFHPESVLTTHGKTMIQNWLNIPSATLK